MLLVCASINVRFAACVDADVNGETYYDVLGVEKDADLATIKRAYKKQALKYHPDRNKGNEKLAEEQFTRIAEAYEVLGDEKKRAEYDRFGKSGEGFSGFDFSDFGGFGDRKSAFDIFDDMFDGEDPFADMKKYFDDFTEEVFEGSEKQDAHDPKAAFEEFYRSVGQEEKVGGAGALLEKYKGKEAKLYKKLKKKYKKKKYRKAIRKLGSSWSSLFLGFKKDSESKFGGIFDGDSPLSGLFGGSPMGGGASSFSFSMSSKQKGPDGKFHTKRVETKTVGNKRTTRTIKSDGITTEAMEEERDGTGRVKRRKGIKVEPGSKVKKEKGQDARIGSRGKEL